MAKIEIYTTQYCPYCVLAKQLLQRKGVAYEEHDLTMLSDEELHRKMVTLSGRRTVPQIVIDGRPLGGYDDLRRLDLSGELDRLLSGTWE
jgi:glutaredoxin 3